MNDIMEIFEKEVSHYCDHATVWEFDYNVHISKRYQYLYTETPKAACSTIKLILQRMELDSPGLFHTNIEDIHNRKCSPLLMPSHFRPFDAFVARSDIFKFCFVRNPYSRLLSAYLNKIKGNRPEKLDVLIHLNSNYPDLEQEISFPAFIDIIRNQTPREMNTHWRPQYYQTFQNQISYDFVGRLENFDADLSYVLSKFRPNYAEFISNELRHATGADDLLNEYYTPELGKIVREIYEVDFESFGYDTRLCPVSG